MPTHSLKVLIVAEHASLQFGGEASLPLHYFRTLRKRNVEAWLVVHDRTQAELETLFTEDLDRIYFIRDTWLQKLLFRCGRSLPRRLDDFTLGFLIRLQTQLAQRRIVKRLVKQHNIDVIHQPIPVSPKEPSIIFDLDAPVIIGPMNGGMNYPPTFQKMQSGFVTSALKVGRLASQLLNRLMPGKALASCLLVANQRTQRALPAGIQGQVIEIVENGVDLSVWRPVHRTKSPEERQQPAKFVFVGRLVDWKAVDLLLIAFQSVLQQVPAELEIMGDGVERPRLEQLARDLKLTHHGSEPDRIRFMGWLSQTDCALRLQSADVLVLPSLLECGGAVVLEAMAIGIPVIATRWGGPIDYLDESCGILVNLASRDEFIAALSASMMQLARSPELRRQMGKAGRQRVIDCFDWEVKVDRMLEIYRAVAEREHSKSRQKVYQTTY
jgi:glycosyltransferase involved in cell wall biosynthesis